MIFISIKNISMKNILYKYVKLGQSSGNGLVKLKTKSKINIAHFSNLYFFALVFIFLQFLSLESLAQQCDANRLVNGDFSNSLTGWQQTGVVAGPFLQVPLIMPITRSVVLPVRGLVKTSAWW
jgi:hypothetical protein